MLMGDPAFQELLAYYATQKEMVLVDVWQRMRQLGLHSLDELQERLENEPEGFTKRELMEMAKLMLIDGSNAKSTSEGKGGAFGGGGGSGVHVEVKFVSAKTEVVAEVAGIPRPVIDVTEAK
jgi:hypothetical protein